VFVRFSQFLVFIGRVREFLQCSAPTLTDWLAGHQAIVERRSGCRPLRCAPRSKTRSRKSSAETRPYSPFTYALAAVALCLGMAIPPDEAEKRLSRAGF
jgi:hypothetical protein